MLSRQPDEHRVQPRRPVAEVQAQARLHLLLLSARPEVQHHDEVGLCRQRPGHALGRDVRRVSGKPAEKKPLGAPDRMRNQPFVAGLRILRVELARRSGGIELHRRMMDDARVAREKLPRPDVSRLVACRSAGRSFDRRPRRWRAACRTAFAARDRALRGPTRRSMSAAAGSRAGSPSTAPPSNHARSVAICSSVSRRSSANSPIARLRLPGRHHAVARRRDDLAGVALDVFVGEQGERRDSFGSMTRGARVEDDRRDVLRKRHRGPLRVRTSIAPSAPPSARPSGARSAYDALMASTDAQVATLPQRLLVMGNRNTAVQNCGIAGLQHRRT